MFEFIEAKWGKEGIRQFLFSLRKSVIGGGEDAYEEALRDEEGRVRPALRALPEGSLQAVPRQGAAGRLRPRPVAEQGEDQLRRGAVDRAVAVGRPDRRGHRQPQGSGARHRPGLVEGRLGRPQPDQRLRQGPRASTTSCTPGGDWNTVPWMSWSPKGDRLAYFVRTEKERDADHPERADPQDRGADRR